MSAILDMLREKARCGERCPTNDLLGGNILPALARSGDLKIEVYSKNWRVVEIDGMRTMEPPHGGKPYLVIDANGRHERGRRVPQVGRKKLDDAEREHHPNLLQGDPSDRLKAVLGKSR